MLALLLMTLVPVALVSLLQTGGDAAEDGVDAPDGPDLAGAEGMDGDPFDMDDPDALPATLPPSLTEIADFRPALDRLQLVVDGDGGGEVATAADPDGRGTLVSYDGRVVALVRGVSAGEIGAIDVNPRGA